MTPKDSLTRDKSGVKELTKSNTRANLTTLGNKSTIGKIGDRQKTPIKTIAKPGVGSGIAKKPSNVAGNKPAQITPKASNMPKILKSNDLKMKDSLAGGKSITSTTTKKTNADSGNEKKKIDEKILNRYNSSKSPSRNSKKENNAKDEQLNIKSNLSEHAQNKLISPKSNIPPVETNQEQIPTQNADVQQSQQINQTLNTTINKELNVSNIIGGIDSSAMDHELITEGPMMSSFVKVDENNLHSHNYNNVVIDNNKVELKTDNMSKFKQIIEEENKKIFDSIGCFMKPSQLVNTLFLVSKKSRVLSLSYLVSYLDNEKKPLESKISEIKQVRISFSY